METMQSVVLMVHTFIAVMIIVLVLIQRGKGAEAGAAFGAGASGTVFGSRGSTSFFSRATAVLATAFFVSSLTLAYMSSQHSDAPDSLIEGAAPIEEEQDATEPATEQFPELPTLDNEQPAPLEGEQPTAEGGELPALQEAAPAEADDEKTQ